MTDLTHGELFAGISGFGAGFERAGIKTVWMVEIDPQCQKVLRKHHPDALLFSDVKDCGAHNLPYVDVITFGSPCQDLSVAGKREGLAGERSGLFFEAIRIIRELRPAIAVWENVPGALSSRGGRDFGAALDALAQSGALDIGWAILDAQWFGVPQRRRRVFTVADFRKRRSGEILSIPYGLRRDTPPSRQTGQRVAPTITGGFKGAGGGNRYGMGHETAESFITDQPTEAEYQASDEYIESNRGGTDDAVIPWTRIDPNAAPAGTIRTRQNHKDSQTYVVQDDQGQGQGEAEVFGGNNTQGALEVAAAIRAKGGTGHGDFESENFVVSPTLLSRQNPSGGTRPPGTSADDASMLVVAVTLPADYGKSGGNGMGEMENGIMAWPNADPTHPLTSEGADASEDGTGRGTPLVFTDGMPGSEAWAAQADQPAPAGSAGEYDEAQEAGADPPLAFDWQSGGDVRLNVSGDRTSALQSSQTPAVFEARLARNGRGALEEIVPPLKAQSGESGRGDSAPLLLEPQAVTSKGNGEAFLSDVHGSLTGGGGQAGQGYPAALVPLSENDAQGVGLWQNKGQSGEVRVTGDVAPTMSRYQGAGGGNVPNYGVRRLMPIECCRLQAFPDTWLDGLGLSDGAMYRQLGNAVCTYVAEWLARRIRMVEHDQRHA